MVTYLLTYLCSLLVFIAFDCVWLLSMTRVLYRPTLGDILIDHLRIAPAVGFYALYPLALVIFAIGPALKSESVVSAAVFGALFGLFAYATYDLTNFATLRNWNWTITIADMLWGAFASGATAVLTYYAVRALGSALGNGSQ